MVNIVTPYLSLYGHPNNLVNNVLIPFKHTSYLTIAVWFFGGGAAIWWCLRTGGGGSGGVLSSLGGYMVFWRGRYPTLRFGGACGLGVGAW